MIWRVRMDHCLNAIRTAMIQLNILSFSRITLDWNRFIIHFKNSNKKIYFLNNLYTHTHTHTQTHTPQNLVLWVSYCNLCGSLLLWPRAPQGQRPRSVALGEGVTSTMGRAPTHHYSELLLILCQSLCMTERTQFSSHVFLHPSAWCWVTLNTSLSLANVPF